MKGLPIFWVILFGTLLVWREGTDHWQALWIERWMLTLGMILGASLWQGSKAVAWPYKVFFGYIFLSTLDHAFAQPSGLYPPEVGMMVQMTASYTLLILLALYHFYTLNVDGAKFIRAVRWMGYAVSGAIFYGWAAGRPTMPGCMTCPPIPGLLTSAGWIFIRAAMWPG